MLEDVKKDYRFVLNKGLPHGGTTVDRAGNPMPQSGVVVYFQKFFVPVAYGKADTKGKINLKHVPAGTVRLYITNDARGAYFWDMAESGQTDLKFSSNPL